MVLPVVVVVAVLVNVLGPDGDARPAGDGAPAEVGGTVPTPRAELPVLPVPVPPVTPEAEAACPGLMAELPLELAGEPSRRVDSDTPYAYAWGEPPLVLVCGVDRPEGFDLGASLIQINGVQWFVDTDDPDLTVWTAVDRPVYVEVQVPAAVDSAGVTQLTVPIGRTLEAREPAPAG
ncbi:DUF3515 domain-containing protein [Geodermatophilus sp. YIM 151500]|uniref:DUF3515 domain-containing protein n=1 Tax=Geodermatophilus sp. YIM 151500 TaxID=2984531 RepID=UPI0021E51238|nr:DUF3515 domain-containing protein [Geodermatophilus sp. YIM 151500]MCV2488923.1 DUF3515 domain-containing protein [Geodermatophilus sp. YIM 151500]